MFTIGPPLWGGEEGDPYWSYVKTLLHFDGGVTDSSTSAVGYSLSGSAAITASDQLYGAGALDCRNSSSDGCGGGGAAVNLTTQDFCVEYWMKDDAVAGQTTHHFLSSSSSNSRGVRVYNSGTRQMQLDISLMSTVDPAYTYLANTWYHVAVVRQGNTAWLYVGGVLRQTHTVGATADLGGSITAWWIGRSSSSGTSLKLLIDEFRITIGVPRYTTAFTPAGPFPNRGL